MAYVECVLNECTAVVDLLYLGACTAVAYICLPVLVRSEGSLLTCLAYTLYSKQGKIQSANGQLWRPYAFYSVRFVF